MRSAGRSDVFNDRMLGALQSVEVRHSNRDPGRQFISRFMFVIGAAAIGVAVALLGNLERMMTTIV